MTTETPGQSKKFFCREWAFVKLVHCLESKTNSKPGNNGGALIIGGPGSGKTTLCKEIVFPSAESSFSQQHNLRKKLLAYHFCQSYDLATFSVQNFIQSLVEQFSSSESPFSEAFSTIVEDESIKALLKSDQLLQDSDEVFKKALILPLAQIKHPKTSYFILVDSIDETHVTNKKIYSDKATCSIADLLARNHHLFPPWLFLFCTVRRQSKSIKKMFLGFHKLSLDDLRKSHVIRDMQQYILLRLASEESLRVHMNRDTAEMLNQLHIKSNGCFLYLERVLDGISNGLIILREIKDIPGTLNGLYLWLSQRLLSTKQFLKSPQTKEVSDTPCSDTPVSRITMFDSKNQSVLHKLCAENNINLLKTFLKSCEALDLELVDKHGQTALNVAAHQGFVDAVQILLEAGANINHTDCEGWTPLRSASWGGHSAVVKLLLQSGADVNCSDMGGRTALRAAAWGGHLEVVKLLLAAGAHVNAADSEGRTALIASAYMGHADIVSSILEYDADINQQDNDGRTALSVSALCVPSSDGYAKVVSILLEKGAKVDHEDREGMTPLLVAAFEGHRDVCEILLENEADQDHIDKSGRTPLWAAASMGHASCVALLLFWGAYVDTIDAEGRTVLSVAAAQGNIDVVNQLLDRGLDEQHRDNCGWTPLHYAAIEGHEEVCRALLEAGAKVDQVDNDGRAPLILAAQDGHYHLVEMFLEQYEANVNQKSHDGRTALRLHTYVIQPLLNIILSSLFPLTVEDLFTKFSTTNPHISRQEYKKRLHILRKIISIANNEHIILFHHSFSEWLLDVKHCTKRYLCSLNDGHLIHAVDLSQRASTLSSLEVYCLAYYLSRVEFHYDESNAQMDSNFLSTLWLMSLDLPVVDLSEYLDMDSKTLSLLVSAKIISPIVEDKQVPPVQIYLELNKLSKCNIPSATDEHFSRDTHMRIILGSSKVGEKISKAASKASPPPGIAAQEGHEDCVRLLLHYGADPKHSDHCGRNAFRVAAKSGHETVLRLLKQYADDTVSADSSEKLSDCTETPIPILATADSPSASPESTAKRKSLMSCHSKSSSNHTNSTKSSHNENLFQWSQISWFSR
ncbi:ankyrin repeat domain-containing protein 50-like [Diaphorina citri]|uniref:Ankyrin repeat domain-containing protein 50-like n=1 Tax=Diaphorina citri TaxID=121845 RepID=A0A3Q0JEQ2_DIACI|nr:ankyrin repeat domain-containing protein 50-like [Diaphorina citri]